MKVRDLFAAEDRSAIEKYCRAQTQQAYLGDHTALCRVLGQFLMYVDTRDLSLTPHLLMNGYWEMWVTQAIAGYVKPGMRCIDVGANFGYYTLLLSELVGDKGRVFAYEPQARLYELLQKTGMINGGRVTVMNCAISDSLTTQCLFTSETLLGSASLKHADGLDASGQAVMCAPLDALFAEQGVDELLPIDFVKIDVQGHEMRALAGMQKVIDLSPKIAIAMEFTPGEHKKPLAALDKILSYGLTIRTIGTDGLVRAITLEEAAKPDTGDHRMLWLSKG